MGEAPARVKLESPTCQRSGDHWSCLGIIYITIYMVNFTYVSSLLLFDRVNNELRNIHDTWHMFKICNTHTHCHSPHLKIPITIRLTCIVLFFCLFVCLSVCFVVCLFVCLFICLFDWFDFIWFDLICLFVRLFVCSFVCLFLCLSVCCGFVICGGCCCRHCRHHRCC